MDEGPPSSYLLLAKETPVFGSDGGVLVKVKAVLCDPGDDIFDGLVLASSLGNRYLEASLVSAIHERGVDVSIPAAEVDAGSDARGAHLAHTSPGNGRKAGETLGAGKA
jgi:hypothetical protein